MGAEEEVKVAAVAAAGSVRSQIGTCQRNTFQYAHSEGALCCALVIHLEKQCMLLYALHCHAPPSTE